MLLSLLLAGCAPDTPKSDYAPPVEQDPAAQCVPYEEPTEAALGWSDPGEGGVSAEDVLGFAVGTFTGTLAWDDADATTVTLEIAPVGALQLLTGPLDACPVEVTGLATWALTTADGRLDPTGEAEWAVSDAAWPPGGVTIATTLDPASIGYAPLGAGSTSYLRLFLTNDGALASVVVEEVWPLGADQNRVCVRGSLDATAIGCHDTGEYTGD